MLKRHYHKLFRLMKHVDESSLSHGTIRYVLTVPLIHIKNLIIVEIFVYFAVLFDGINGKKEVKIISFLFSNLQERFFHYKYDFYVRFIFSGRIDNKPKIFYFQK